jgi:hypothetical protein
MNKRFFFGTLAVIVMLAFTSCENKQYITTPSSTISFVNDIVPILTSGACGCHNNGKGTAKPFSNLFKVNNGGDTIYYDAIYSEVGNLKNWVDSVAGHPGGGSVALTPAQAVVIKEWIAQGAPDDYNSGGASGNVSFAADIQPIIYNVCSGASCHGTNGGGSLGPALNYTSLTTSLNSALVNFLNTNWAGMDNGNAVQSPSVTQTLKTWIAQGMQP